MSTELPVVDLTQHLPGCETTHNPEDDECTVVRTLVCDGEEEEVTVTLVGIPCDTAYLDAGGYYFAGEQVGWLQGVLAELGPLLDQWRVYATCDLHTHADDPSDEDDAEDDFDDPCADCGATEVGLYKEAGADEWLCGPCTLARGYPPPVTYRP